MAKIVVGQEFRKEFESIRSLYKNGFISDKVNIKKVTDNEIVTAANTFVYADDAHGVNGSKDDTTAEFRIDGDGASWFSLFRGKSFDSSSADWEQLISDVAADYHKYYSMIEFRQTLESRISSVSTAMAGITDKFDREFLQRVFAADLVMPEKYTADAENYYAVSMRLEISGGAQSEPLLGKIYFRKLRNGKYVPVRFQEAVDIDDYINAAVPSEKSSDGGGNEQVDGQLVGDVLAEIGELFERDDAADYIMFNKDFEPKIKQMLSLLATSDEKELECTHVTVLGISHVEWQNFAYYISMAGHNVLKLVMGLNNSVSLYCINDHTDAMGNPIEIALIDNNEVVFEPDEDGDIPEYVLDFNKPNLGLDDEDVEYIQQNAVLNRHLLTVSCSDNARNRGCTHSICAEHAVSYTDGAGETVYKCKGCPYPEVIYRNIFDTTGSEHGKLTSLLVLDEQSFTLTDAETRTCRCCGRRFSAEEGKNGYCRLCGDVTVTETGKKLYKRYSSMLGLGVRLKHLFAHKHCKEDSTVIVFELGGDRYVFNKQNALPYGFVPKPRKIK